MLPLIVTAVVGSPTVAAVARNFLSASPVRILVFPKRESTVTVSHVRGPLTMEIDDQAVVAISGFRREGSTAHFVVTRLAGGGATITLRDSSEQRVQVSVNESGCTPPVPNFFLLYPLTTDDTFDNAPMPYRSIKTFPLHEMHAKLETIGQHDMAGDFFIQFTQIGYGVGNRFKLRLFNRHGDSAESDFLQEITAADVPPNSATTPPLGSAKQYFKAHVSGILPHTPYYVQAWAPDECATPIVFGTIVTPGNSGRPPTLPLVPSPARPTG